MSRNNKLISLFVVLGTLLSTQAFASGFGVRESSALSTGRLHTNTARFLTPATIFFNPAGLSDLKGFQATIGGQVLVASFSYEDDDILGSKGTRGLETYLQVEQSIKERVQLRLRGRLGRYLPNAPQACDFGADDAYSPSDYDLRHFGELLFTARVKF